MRHLVSTAATEHTCTRCHQPILVAYDQGLLAKVDPQPLDHPGEIAALLASRWTYTLTYDRDLVHRDAGRITDPHLHGTVHAQHRCRRSTP